MVIDHLRTGGAQEVLFLLACELASRGHTVSTISLGSANAYEERFAEADLTLHVLGYQRRNLLQCARALRSCIGTHNPQIVQSFLFKADMLTRTMLHGAQRPRLVSSIVRGSGSHVRWQSQAYRLTARRPDFVTAPTEDGCRYAVAELGAEPDRIRVIRNGVDLGQFAGADDRLALRKTLGIPAESFTIVSVGRLAPVKSYDVLIDSIAIVADEVPDARLIIVGNGALYDHLTGRAAPLGDKALFPGYRDDAWKFAGAADVFVSTSRSEGGNSYALLEAMAQGIPPVATDVVGNNETVRHVQNGLLVPWNDARALASALKLLHKDRDLAARLGQSAREWVQTHHNAEKMVTEYETVYREMLRAGSPLRIDSQETSV